MKKLYLLLVVGLCISINSVKATNVVIIQSAPYGMDAVWLGVCNTLGYNASTYPEAILSTNTWFDTTDILIVSYAQMPLTADQIDTIQSFLLQGGRVYMQAEYLSTFLTNVAFQQIVNANGGSFTWAPNTTPGTLVPMYVLGSLSQKPDTVTPLTYYWYGDSGSIGCNSHIEPFLEYQGGYYGFIFCVPANNSRMITTSDQDWVQQSTSLQLMENILVNLASPTYTCVVSAAGGLNVNLGPDRHICNGQAITLNGTATGATAYLWSNNAVTDTISVNTPGTYWVQASNGSCMASDTVVILPGPIPALTLNPAICINTTYTLPGGTVVSSPGTYTDTLITSGGCDSIIITNLSIQAILNSITNAAICSGAQYTLPSGTIVSAAGTYHDTLTATTGCDSVVTTNLTVNPPATIRPLGNDTTYCGAFTRILNAGNAGAVWSTGATGIQIAVSAAGTYWASVNNGCSTAADTIIISQGTAPVVNLGNFTVVCSGQTVQLDAGNPGSTYTWNNGAQTETIAAGPGSYSVTVTNAQGCSAAGNLLVGTDSVSERISVLNAACGLNNGSAQVSINIGFSPYTYTWSNGDTVALASNLGAGTYTVTIMDAAGCSSTGGAVVISGGSSPVSISSPDTVICPGDSATICATPGFASYNWNTGDTSICISTPYSGAYYVQAVYSAGCVVTSNRVNIQTLTPSPVTVSVNGDTMTCYQALSYQWYLNGTLLPGDTFSRLIAAQTGNYTVTIKGPNGCYATSSVVHIGTLAINDISTGEVLNVYPNPLSSGNWHLDVSDNMIGSWCEVFDADGRIVYKSQIRNAQSEIELNVARGVYVLQIHSADANYNLKLIKLN